MRIVVVTRTFIAAPMMIVGSIFGQTQATETKANLKDIYRALVARYHIVEQNKLTAQAGKFAVEAAGLAENPTLSAEFGRKEGAQSGFLYELRIEQQFQPPGFNTAQKKIAQAEQARRMALGRRGSLALKAGVLRDLYQLHYGREYRTHIGERLKRWDWILAHLQSRPRISARDRATLLIVQSKIGLLKQEQEHLVNTNTELEKRLGAVYSDAESIGLSVGEPPLPGVSEKQYLELVLSGNSDLSYYKAATQQSEALLLQADSLKYPAYGLGGYYRREPGNQSEHFFGVAASVKLPIFQNGSSSAEKARLDLKRQKLNQAGLRRRLSGESAALYSKLKNHHRMVQEFSKKELGNLDRQMAVLDREFRLGRLEVNVYFDAEAVSHERVHQQIENRIRYADTLLEFALLTGSEGFLEEVFRVN